MEAKIYPAHSKEISLQLILHLILSIVIRVKNTIQFIIRYIGVVSTLTYNIPTYPMIG
jgi:hypothetical protein